MKLTKLAIRGMKCRDLSLTLGAANVLTGDNFAGKTEVLQAVELLLLGYCVALGNQNAATFQLASGPVLEVSGQIEDGLVVYALSRRWTLKGNSIAKTSEIPDALTARLAGANLGVMLSAQEYFALGATDRVRYVAKHCPAANSLSTRTILMRLTDAAPTKGEEIKGLGAGLADPFNPTAFVEAAIAEVSDLWKGANAHGKRMEQTVQGITNMRATDAAEGRPPSASTSEEIAEARAGFQRRLKDLGEEKGRHLAAFTQMKSDAARREVIRRELDALGKTLAPLEGNRAKLLDVVSAIAVAPRVSEEDVAAGVTMINTAIDQRSALKRRIADADTELGKVAAEASADAAASKCPYCGAAGEGWRKLRRLGHDNRAYLANQERDAAAKELPQVEEIIARNIEAQNVRKASRAALQSLEGVRADLEGKINRLTASESRVASLNEESARLMVNDPELTTKVEMLQTEINIVTQDLARLDGDAESAAGIARDRERLAQAEIDRDAARADATAWEAVGKELKAIQAQLVEDAFKPLIEGANAIFPGIMQTPLDYRGGDIGTWRGGTWVPHKAFSGTEQALTFAAIQAALSATSPIKLMLLDELGRLTGANVEKLVDCVAAAIATGRIDQFIGVDPERPELYGKDLFNVVAVG